MLAVRAFDHEIGRPKGTTVPFGCDRGLFRILKSEWNYGPDGPIGPINTLLGGFPAHRLDLYPDPVPLHSAEAFKVVSAASHPRWIPTTDLFAGERTATTRGDAPLPNLEGDAQSSHYALR